MNPQRLWLNRKEACIKHAVVHRTEGQPVLRIIRSLHLLRQQMGGIENFQNPAVTYSTTHPIPPKDQKFEALLPLTGYNLSLLRYSLIDKDKRLLLLKLLQ